MTILVLIYKLAFVRKENILEVDFDILLKREFE